MRRAIPRCIGRPQIGSLASAIIFTSCSPRCILKTFAAVFYCFDSCSWMMSEASPDVHRSIEYKLIRLVSCYGWILQEIPLATVRTLGLDDWSSLLHVLLSAFGPLSGFVLFTTVGMEVQMSSAPSAGDFVLWIDGEYVAFRSRTKMQRKLRAEAQTYRTFIWSGVHLRPTRLHIPPVSPTIRHDCCFQGLPCMCVHPTRRAEGTHDVRQQGGDRFISTIKPRCNSVMDDAEVLKLA